LPGEDGRATGKACAVLLAAAGGRTPDENYVLSNVAKDCFVAASGKLADRPQRRESELRRAKEGWIVGGAVDLEALDEVGEARTPANRPTFPSRLFGFSP